MGTGRCGPFEYCTDYGERSHQTVSKNYSFCLKDEPKWSQTRVRLLTSQVLAARPAHKNRAVPRTGICIIICLTTYNQRLHDGGDNALSFEDDKVPTFHLLWNMRTWRFGTFEMFHVAAGRRWLLLFAPTLNAWSEEMCLPPWTMAFVRLLSDLTNSHSVVFGH